MASTAPIVFFVAFLLAATALSGSKNAIAMALSRSTEAFPPAAAHNGQYTCYLCRKRSSLMIRRCPIAQDDCHLKCLTLPTPAPPSPPRAVAVASGGGGRDADDCYVTKVYPDGSGGPWNWGAGWQGPWPL